MNPFFRESEAGSLASLAWKHSSALHLEFNDLILSPLGDQREIMCEFDSINSIKIRVSTVQRYRTTFGNEIR